MDPELETEPVVDDEAFGLRRAEALREERVRSMLRVAGFVLIAVGVSVAVGARNRTRLRAKWAEFDANFWNQQGAPGSVLAITGVSLLDAGDARVTRVR